MEFSAHVDPAGDLLDPWPLLDFFLFVGKCPFRVIYRLAPWPLKLSAGRRLRGDLRAWALSGWKAVDFGTALCRRRFVALAEPTFSSLFLTHKIRLP